MPRLLIRINIQRKGTQVSIPARAELLPSREFQSEMMTSREGVVR